MIITRNKKSITIKGGGWVILSGSALQSGQGMSNHTASCSFPYTLNLNFPAWLLWGDSPTDQLTDRSTWLTTFPPTNARLPTCISVCPHPCLCVSVTVISTLVKLLCSIDRCVCSNYACIGVTSIEQDRYRSHLPVARSSPTWPDAWVVFSWTPNPIYPEP